MTQPLPIQAEIGIVPAPDDTLAACHAPAALLDPEGRVVALSPAAVELMREIALEPAMARIAEAIATLAHPQGPADVSVTLPGADGAAKRCLELVLLPYDAADRSLLLMRDISLEHNLREALAESRQRFKDLVEASSDGLGRLGLAATKISHLTQPRLDGLRPIGYQGSHATEQIRSPGERVLLLVGGLALGPISIEVLVELGEP